jgi:hypothetical protein
MASSDRLTAQAMMDNGRGDIVQVGSLNAKIVEIS